MTTPARAGQQAQRPSARAQRQAASSTSTRAAAPRGVLNSQALQPSARKLPFLVIGLVGLAILLLALGALPARLVPDPGFAETLAERRVLVAGAGLAILVAAVIAYLSV